MFNADTTVFLTKAQEKQFLINWCKPCKSKGCKKFLLSFKPLVLNIVKKYQHYGILREDLVQEAWLGLFIALCKYDHSRNLRFSTYARWWINYYCQDYVMRNWSIVRIGTTTTHKKLFFQLKYLENDLEKIDSDSCETEGIIRIAKNLAVSIHQVEIMKYRLTHQDKFLDQKIHKNTQTTFCDILPDDKETIETVLINDEEQRLNKLLYDKLQKELKARALDILLKRKMYDTPQTLEELSNFYGISKERIRQIEKHAIIKAKKILEHQKTTLFGI